MSGDIKAITIFYSLNKEIEMYYSKLKVLHHKEKLDSFDDGQITAPIHVRIKPTNVCNHNCSYCSYQNSYGQLGKDMQREDRIPREKMDEIIKDCAQMGVKAITFSGGGEPLLYPGLINVLADCHNQGISTAILTNGVLLRDALLLVAMDTCSWIRISMDGWDRESYANYRKCNPDDFDHLIKNIGIAAKVTSKCVLGVNIIVDKENAGHIYDMVKMVHDLGIQSIKISPCIMSNEGKANNDIHYRLRPMVQAQLARIKEEGIQVYDSFHQQLGSFKKDYGWCPYVQILPIIGADQNVYACHDKAYNKDTGLLGSIRDQGFKEFWFDGKDKFYKINPAKDCNHHCITDQTNKMLFEYILVGHKEFV